jgi:hypothetical protein
VQILRSRQSLKKKLQTLKNDPGTELWALNEVILQQHGSICKMWIALEDHDPIILHHPTRRGIGYYGAVRIKDGKFIYLRELNVFNAERSYYFSKC